MTALLAKATAVALAQHPTVNAGCFQGSSFAFNSSVNVAVAVAMDGGLITPVLKDADKVRTSSAAGEVPSMGQVSARIHWCPGCCVHMRLLSRYLWVQAVKVPQGDVSKLQPGLYCCCCVSHLQMDIYSLSAKWRELVDKAREKRLSPDEYSTGERSLRRAWLCTLESAR